MSRLLVAIALISCLCVAVFADSSHPGFLDPSSMTLGETGRSYIQLAITDTTTFTTLSRAISHRLDITALVSPLNLFSVSLQALVIDRLGPLNLALDFSSSGIRMKAGLLLGPLHIYWGRELADFRKWFLANASLSQNLVIEAGVEILQDTYQPIFGIILFPQNMPITIRGEYHGGRIIIAVGAFM